MVVTNHSELGSTGKKTGYYLPEAAHPYHTFVAESGARVVFVSPAGGESPVDPGSVEFFGQEQACQDFLASAEVTEALKNTISAQDADWSQCDAVFFVGGHGPLWDCVENEVLNQRVAEAYEAGKVVGAVCHGPCGLTEVKLSDGKFLVDGKEVTSFTNKEEELVNLQEVVPFPLETRLKERNAIFSCAPEPWKEHVVVSDRLVTGQNPASATATAKAIVALL